MTDKEIIDKYYALGSCRAVAEQCNIGAEKVRGVLIRNGISRTGRGRKSTKSCKKYKYPSRYKKVSYERICAYCGKEYTAHDIRKQYCSRRCRDIAIRIRKGIKCNTNSEPYHKACVICGKPFDTFRDAAVTCSQECAKVLHKGLSRNPLIEKTCKICGKVYFSKDARRVTCGSADCVRKNKTVNHKPPVKHMIKIVSRKCVVCGSRFDVDYRLSTKTCSKNCSLENARISQKRRNKRHDKRISRDKRIDNITLKKLYRRDEGKCYLCGGVCNWNDWRVSDNGNKYPGDTYPTIEHVVPISRGGFDSWDNVRLACWKCNLEKSDSILKVEPIDKVFAYSEKRLGTQPKKTAQYTLDGKLIKIWESTRQIERCTEWKSKSIQNACRKDGKSKSGNMYGYHWEYIEESNDKCG